MRAPTEFPGPIVQPQLVAMAALPDEDELKKVRLPNLTEELAFGILCKWYVVGPMIHRP